MTEIPAHLEAALRRELDEGEEAVWTGRPDPRGFVRRMTAPTLFLVIMTFVLGAGVLAVAIFVPKQANDDSGIVLGIFGGLMCAGAAWGAVVYPSQLRLRALRTVYAVTPRRAIVLEVRSNRTIERDYRADELVHLARFERADGAGDLLFESARSATRSGGVHHGFFAIPDVLAVERMLRERFGGHGL